MRQADIDKIAALEREALQAGGTDDARRAARLRDTILDQPLAQSAGLNQARVFDDTTGHEAWNDSDALRVVLIFDIWHPHLSEAERALITAMSAGIDAFARESGGFAP